MIKRFFLIVGLGVLVFSGTAFIGVNKVAAAYCWCVTPDNKCENHTKDGGGNAINKENECSTYCTSRGKGWAMLYFDQVYTDWNAKTAKEGGCKDLTVNKPAEKKPAAGAEGELSALAAKSLNPAKFTAATDLIGRAIKLLIAFVGSITLVLYVYVGILWMTAGGASEQVNKAKSIALWTTLGLVVMLGSYVLVTFVFKLIG